MPPNNVQFDTDQKQYINSSQQNQPKGINGFLIKKGLAKDTAGANKILIIVLVVIVILIILINR